MGLTAFNIPKFLNYNLCMKLSFLSSRLSRNGRGKKFWLLRWPWLLSFIPFRWYLVACGVKPRLMVSQNRSIRNTTLSAQSHTLKFPNLMNTRNKSYPSIRFVAERLKSIADILQRDFYTCNKLSKSEKFALGSDIQELRSHVLTLLHYAPLVAIEEDTYPRTLEDITSDYFSF